MREIFLCVILLLSIAVFPQRDLVPVTATVGESYDVIDSKDKKYIVLDTTSVLMVKTSNKIVYIQKYDFNAQKLVSSNSYSSFPTGFVFIDLIQVNDNIYYIYEAENKETNSISVFSRQINTKETSFSDEKQLISTNLAVLKTTVQDLNNAHGYYLFNYSEKGPRFIIDMSYDKSRILLTYKFKSEKSKGIIYGLSVFDNEMKKIWEHELNTDQLEIDFMDCSIAANGKALMVGLNRKKKTLNIFSFDEKGIAELEDYELIDEESYLYNFSIKEGPDNTFYCSGYYTEKLIGKRSNSESFLNAKGAMFLQFDGSGKVIRMEKNQFDIEILKQNISEKEQKKLDRLSIKGNAYFSNLVLLDYFINKDGSTILVGEKQYMPNRDITAAGQVPKGGSMYNEYCFSDVIIVKLDNVGKMVWMQKVPKHQWRMYGGNHMGIKYMKEEDYHYVAFFDNPNNIEILENGCSPELYKGKNGHLTLFSIDLSNGCMNHYSLCNLQNIQSYVPRQYKPTRIFQVNDRLFFMEIYLGQKRDAMVKFKLN